MSKNSRKVSNKNKQGILFWPKFAQKWILGSEIRKSNSKFGISSSKIPCVPKVFCKKGVLRNFTKFTGKYLCQSLCNFIKKRLWHRCFPVNFAKFLRTPFP